MPRLYAFFLAAVPELAFLAAAVLAAGARSALSEAGLPNTENTSGPFAASFLLGLEGLGLGCLGLAAAAPDGLACKRRSMGRDASCRVNTRPYASTRMLLLRARRTFCMGWWGNAGLAWRISIQVKLAEPCFRSSETRRRDTQVLDT